MADCERPTRGSTGFTEALSGRLSLQHPAVRAASWTFGSYFASQALRFASNLILTRLLVPQAFGLMLIANVVLQGLEMISDLGLGPSVIQNPRGGEPSFLRTAWTIQILRSFVLWGCAALIAWPLAAFYEEPLLTTLLPILGLSIVIDAFTSAQVGAKERRLEFGGIVMIELFCYGLGIITMIVGAYLSRTVWPLVAGRFVTSLTSTVLTHLVLGGPGMRFEFNRELAREIFHFGKWLFISSMLTFLCGQLDRIVLGKFMTMYRLGIYSIAFMLSQVMVQIVTHVSRKILFPVYARTAQHNPEMLRRQTIRVRTALLLISLPPMWILVIAGPEIIAFLYDPRYLEAGWMVQLLGVGAIFASVLVPVESVLIASGDSYRHMLLQFARSVILLGVMVLGGYYYGEIGVILGFVAASFLYYPILAGFVRRYNAWLPLLDFVPLIVSALIIGFGLWMKTHTL